MIPRYGEVPLRDQRYGLRPGAYAVLPRDGSVLVTHQMEPIPEFQLPGGGIDPGEQPVAALHREVYEETGWTIGQVRRVGVYRQFVFMPDYDRFAEKLCTIYLARPVLQRSEPLEDGHTAVWMSFEDAIGLVANSGDPGFLRRLLLG